MLARHPRVWKCSSGVVIAKLDKDDYSKVKSYEVICLLSGIGKCLECIIEDGIRGQLAVNDRIHWRQLGRRMQRSAQDLGADLMRDSLSFSSIP
jgi:hypothetical protein